MISQSVSEASISLAVPARQLESARAALDAALLRNHVARRIEVDPEVAIVAMVGSGMRGTPGVAARLFGAIAERKINVIAIAQLTRDQAIRRALERARVRTQPVAPTRPTGSRAFHP